MKVYMVGEHLEIGDLVLVKKGIVSKVHVDDLERPSLFKRLFVWLVYKAIYKGVR